MCAGQGGPGAVAGTFPAGSPGHTPQGLFTKPRAAAGPRTHVPRERKDGCLGSGWHGV